MTLAKRPTFFFNKHENLKCKQVLTFKIVTFERSHMPLLSLPKIHWELLSELVPKLYRQNKTSQNENKNHCYACIDIFHSITMSYFILSISDFPTF